MVLALAVLTLVACTGGPSAGPGVTESSTHEEEALDATALLRDTGQGTILSRPDTPAIDAGAPRDDVPPQPHAKPPDVIVEDVPAPAEDVFTPPAEDVFTPPAKDVFTPPAEDVPVPSWEDVPTPVARDVPAPSVVDVPAPRDVPVLRDVAWDVPAPRDVFVSRDVPPDIPPPRDVPPDVFVLRDVASDVFVLRDVALDVFVPRDVPPDLTQPRDVAPDLPAPRDVALDVFVPRDVPPDIPPPRDVATDAPVTPLMVGVPRIDAPLKAAMRALYFRGQTLGNRAAVFAKLGDSITQSASFLSDFGPARGTAHWDLGAYGHLDPTLRYFNSTLVDATHSSFDRESLGADSGWSTVRVMRQELPLIRQELSLLRPAVAFVMFGSGDIEVLDVSEVGVFRGNLTRIVEVVLEAGTIPVLCTVPERRDYPWATARGPAFNDAIREVAAAMRVPLQDYSEALQPLPNHGISEDGVHPSVYRLPNGSLEAAYFTQPALAFGYNVRNLITLITLERLRAIVFDDGPPDP